MSVPPRTNPAAVQAILGGTEKTSNWDGITDLWPFIKAASIVVDRVATAARSKIWVTGGVALSQLELTEIESWLSAHYYCMKDPLYQSKSTGGVSGTFQRKQGEGFETTEYGRVACQLDYSGSLKAIGMRQFAGAVWLGTVMGNEFGCGTAGTIPVNPNGLWQG